MTTFYHHSVRKGRGGLGPEGGGGCSPKNYINMEFLLDGRGGGGNCDPPNLPKSANAQGKTFCLQQCNFNSV